MSLFTELILSSAGVSFLLLIVARLVPNDRLKALGVRVGMAVSMYGGKKIGKAGWRKVEVFLQNSVAVFLEGVKEGMDKDDVEEKNAEPV